jgi:hypothetical protein
MQMALPSVTWGKSPDWPGRSGTGSVILTLPSAFALSLETIRLPEAELTPKRELHITLVSTREAHAVAQSVPESAWAAIFHRQPWHLGLTGRAYLLGEDKPGGKVWSVIAELEDSSVNVFRQALSQVSGVVLPDTLPHVTLWVAGSDRGIGLGSREEFSQRLIREITFEDLFLNTSSITSDRKVHPPLQGDQP